MASNFDYVDGRIVRLVQEDVRDEEAIEDELQSELDAAQDAVNTAVSDMTNAEEQYKAAKELTESASVTLDAAKANKEVAEAMLAKSLDSKQSYLAAIELRDKQSVAEESDEPSESAEGASETVDLPIRVATAEG